MNQTTFIRVVQVQSKVEFYTNICKYWVLIPPHCHYPLIATSYLHPYKVIDIFTSSGCRRGVHIHHVCNPIIQLSPALLCNITILYTIIPLIFIHIFTPPILCLSCFPCHGHTMLNLFIQCRDNNHLLQYQILALPTMPF